VNSAWVGLYNKCGNRHVATVKIKDKDLLIKFIIQPGDYQYAEPKHVVVYTNLCEKNI